MSRKTCPTQLSIFSIAFSLLLVAQICVAKERPDWTSSNTQSQNGKMFHVVCSGVGPSLDLARRDVLEKCRMTAASQLTTTIQAKTVTIESEKEVAFHREVSDDNEYTGLICKPGREHIEESSDQTLVWLECTFNLGEAKVKDNSDSDMKNDISKNKSWISNKSEVTKIKTPTQNDKIGRYLTSDRKLIILSVIPQCSDMLIRGDAPARIIKCDSDPMTLAIEPGDKEIIVRAEKYISKTIQLSPAREGEENVQVFLDPKN